MCLRGPRTGVGLSLKNFHTIRLRASYVMNEWMKLRFVFLFFLSQKSPKNVQLCDYIHPPGRPFSLQIIFPPFIFVYPLVRAITSRRFKVLICAQFFHSTWFSNFSRAQKRNHRRIRNKLKSISTQSAKLGAIPPFLFVHVPISAAPFDDRPFFRAKSPRLSIFEANEPSATNKKSCELLFDFALKYGPGNERS